MNSEKVLRWATLAANFGAVVGLILLVVGLEAWRGYAQSSPALVKFWCAERSEFSPEFVSGFDELLPRDAC